MNNIPNDFTLRSYKRILETALEKKFKFLGFEDIQSTKNQYACILRHDIDSEIFDCQEMVSIERDLGIKSTYFLMLRSTSYNLFCIESLKEVEKIVNAGHSLGLHFMGELCENEVTSVIEEKILLEAELLEKQFGQKISTFSFHQPTSSILSKNISIPSMVNTYDKKQMDNFFYLSDTNMQWKSGHPAVIFSEEKIQRIQLLIHPIWWTKTRVNTAQKWRRVLEMNRKVLVSHWNDRERSLIDIEL